MASRPDSQTNRSGAGRKDLSADVLNSAPNEAFAGRPADKEQLLIAITALQGTAPATLPPRPSAAAACLEPTWAVAPLARRASRTRSSSDGWSGTWPRRLHRGLDGGVLRRRDSRNSAKMMYELGRRTGWARLGACSALNQNAKETPVATSAPAVEPVENTNDRLLGCCLGEGPQTPKRSPIALCATGS
jgi:hypothetical protein